MVVSIIDSFAAIKIHESNGRPVSFLLGAVQSQPVIELSAVGQSGNQGKSRIDLQYDLVGVGQQRCTMSLCLGYEVPAVCYPGVMAQASACTSWQGNDRVTVKPRACCTPLSTPP